MRKTRNTHRPHPLEYEGPLGQVVHDARSFRASKYGITVGTYETFRGAILALLGDREGKIRIDQYRVVIGGAEIVYDGESEIEARRQYRDSVFLSTGEAVTLFKGHEIIREYHPDRE